MVILNVSHSFNLQTLNAKLITTVVATHTHINSAHVSTVTSSLPEKKHMFRTWKTETLVSLHSSAIYQPIPKYIYLKTANIHEKIEYENLLLQNNGLGPLLFLASSTSSSCVHEWHQMSLLPTWSEYVKTVPVLVTKHVTLCILISQKWKCHRVQSNEDIEGETTMLSSMWSTNLPVMWCHIPKATRPHLSSHLHIISQKCIHAVLNVLPIQFCSIDIH